MAKTRHHYLMQYIAKVLVLGAALVAGPGAALAVCPPAQDNAAALHRLFEQVQTAASEREARALSRQMWELWLQAPDETAQSVLDRGMARRSSFDFLGAMADFERLVEYCPDYAEGYNQRAYVHFLRSDLEFALADLDRALMLSPDHVPALSGRALTLLGLGRINEAREQLYAALALNPWIPERALLLPGAPLAPRGEDI